MNTNSNEQLKPIIYYNPVIKVTLEPSEIPWLIVNIQRPVKEISQCTQAEKSMLFDAPPKIHIFPSLSDGEETTTAE